MVFKFAEFWIQFHQIPAALYDQGDWLVPWRDDEEVINVDKGEAGDCVGKFLRVRVRMEIKKPLRRCLRVDNIGDGVETVMIIRYEQLSNHCIKCGMIYHRTSEWHQLLPGKAITGDMGTPLFLAIGRRTENETDKRCEKMVTSNAVVGQIEKPTNGKHRALWSQDDTRLVNFSPKMFLQIETCKPLIRKAVYQKPQELNEEIETGLLYNNSDGITRLVSGKLEVVLPDTSGSHDASNGGTNLIFKAGETNKKPNPGVAINIEPGLE
ncbi:hypothetical protein QYF36_024891 [Acer negundo]|nr:hypothetical protein QYF36_024891 [Acer negundo]